MSFMGTVGIIAQAGQGSTAPTAVSIANSSSGNYDDSVTVDGTGAGCSFYGYDIGAALGTNFASSESGTVWLYTQSIAVTDFNTFNGCDSGVCGNIHGYIRETGATSYAWNITIDSSSLSNGNSVSITGSNSTSQDATSSIANTFCHVFGGGRGGATYPSVGDNFVVLIRANATNSTGTTAAFPKIKVKYEFVS